MPTKAITRLPTAALVSELLRRNPSELVKPDGLLAPEAYQLRLRLGAITCVDGIAVRRVASGQVETMAIRRQTGPYKGKLCFVGGVVAKMESVQDALRRQFRVDIGVKINFYNEGQPCFVCHYGRDTRNGFLPDPTKDHCIGLTFLVRVLGNRYRFGSTDHGGQEAGEVVWFSKKNMPRPREFGYEQHRGYNRAFKLAEQFLTL